MTEEILHTCLFTSQHKLPTYIILVLTGDINLLTSNESVDEISLQHYLIHMTIYACIFKSYLYQCTRFRGTYSKSPPCSHTQSMDVNQDSTFAGYVDIGVYWRHWRIYV